MKDTTKKLLSLRANTKLVQVEPKKFRGAKLNKCFQNAAFYCAANKEYSIISGWLVGDNFDRLGTVLVPHYWLIHEPSGFYYDTSPSSPADIQEYEYVIDMEIYFKANEKSYVPPPVFLKQDGSLCTRLQNGVIVTLETIDIQKLYDLVRN